MNVNKNRNLLIGLSIFVVLMFGFGFALVPIYNSLCKALGVNGKINPTAAAPVAGSEKINHDQREVVVEFVSTNEGSVPWNFYPKVKKVTIKRGEMTSLAFYAENTTNHTMTVQAIPSVTPGIAAKYIKKTECFCFTQQTLGPHEAMDMPLLFHLDSDLPDNIKTITLAYALYDVTARAK